MLRKLTNLSSTLNSPSANVSSCRVVNHKLPLVSSSDKSKFRSEPKKTSLVDMTPNVRANKKLLNTKFMTFCENTMSRPKARWHRKTSTYFGHFLCLTSDLYHAPKIWTCTSACPKDNQQKRKPFQLLCSEPQPDRKTFCTHRPFQSCISSLTSAQQVGLFWLESQETNLSRTSLDCILSIPPKKDCMSRWRSPKLHS